MSLPILTLPDHKISGEGALDPLGVSTISDRLAEQVLPGLRARMARPRFLTAMAVCAAVCQDLEDQVASDGTTPTFVVFEWLVVEGFTRAGKREDTIRTPGMLKAQSAKDSGVPMSASAYLRVPTIFGFHGIYRPLARQMGIVDEDMRLADNGYSLLKGWQAEQGLAGFLDTSVGAGPGTAVRQLLRSAVEAALAKGCSDRNSQWRGWSLLAEHLSPARIAPREARFIHRLLIDDKAGTRGEVCRLIDEAPLPDDMTEAELVDGVLLDKASSDLRRRLVAISRFEAACTLIEDAFDWIRYISSQSGARPIQSKEFAARPEVVRLTAELPAALREAESSIADLDHALAIQQEMASLARALDQARTAEDLFEAILQRHHEVQQDKQPDGKRDWFERAPDGSTLVRIPYRLTREPGPRNYWNRPYRFNAVRSFLDDLSVRTHGQA
jgi:hypothetical protein